MIETNTHKSNVLLGIATLPYIGVASIVGYWSAIALIKTISNLENKEQHTKLRFFRLFRNTLVLIYISAVTTALCIALAEFGIEHDDSVYLRSYLSCLFPFMWIVVLASLMVTTNPSRHSKLLAFVDELQEED